MDDIREILARNLRTRRGELGMSQERLAHEADIDRTYVSSIERCRYGASIDVVDSLAKVLGVEAADLLARTDVRGKRPREPRRGPHNDGMAG